MIKFYDGYCNHCNSENCGLVAGLAECIWEEAARAEKEMAHNLELKDKIVHVANKFNLTPECVSGILEEFGYAPKI